MNAEMPLVRLGLALILILAGGCDLFGSDEGDRIIEGVNLTQLFEAPSPSAVETIVAEWSARDVSAREVEVVHAETVRLGTADAELRVLRHLVDESEHYGAVLSPIGGASGSLPVLVYLHGDDEGIRLSEVQLAAAMGGLGGEFVIVVPSFRSEPLNIAGTVFMSGGAPSPWDRDVDDALALLNAAILTTPAADSSRIGLLGLSRGGGVGLLMAARDSRIDAVVEFFGPTDFFDGYVQEVVADALRGRPRDLPGLNYLDSEFIQPLKRGDIRMEDVRMELVRRSAVLFASRLPSVQLHHGTADPVVDVSQAESLVRTMQKLGRTEAQFVYYIYDGGGHNPLTLPESISRSSTFLKSLLAPKPV